MIIRNQKAEMLNRKASDPKNKPEEVLTELGLRQGQKVADIGAGGGYFTIRFARTVGKGGQVVAIDTNKKFLELIENKAKEKRLCNITTILVKKDKLICPEKNLDLIFMRNIYHHLTNRREYLSQLRSILKADGKIAIIEYLDNKSNSHRLLGHYVPKEIIIKEMESAGYKLEKDLDFLPEQSFTIYLPQTFCIYLSGMYGY